MWGKIYIIIFYRGMQKRPTPNDAFLLKWMICEEIWLAAVSCKFLLSGCGWLFFIYTWKYVHSVLYREPWLEKGKTTYQDLTFDISIAIALLTDSDGVTFYPFRCQVQVRLEGAVSGRDLSYPELIDSFKVFNPLCTVLYL